MSAAKRSGSLRQRPPTSGRVRIVKGKAQLRHWKPTDGGEKWFCGNCGSSIFGRNDRHDDPIGIRMGTFDTDPEIRPTVRAFVADAAPWEAIPDDGLPRHPGSRHAKPSRGSAAAHGKQTLFY